MYWHNTKKRRYFFALIPIVAVAIIVSVVIIGGADKASALTVDQQQLCYDQFNNTALNPLQTRNPLVQAQLDNCISAGACHEATVGTAGNKVLSCNDPATAAQVLTATVTPLVKAVCGEAPPLFNTQTAYITCSNKVRADYQACSISYLNVNALETPAKTANCFVAKGNKISAIAASAAIVTGRADGQKITDAKANLDATTNCTNIGKVIVNGACVAKPADPTPKPTCTIDGIGWIICPVMNFMAKIVDGSYTVVGGLLKTPNLNMNPNDAANGTYQAWSIMRNIANVAFVIAFLIIIFSQLTSVGITNYGVKKMLPRIVIAAILVNLSYFICAIGVDLSNIVGSSMKQVFDGIGGQLSTPGIKDGASQTGVGWAGTVGFLLAGGLASAAALYAGLSVLLPALIAALVAIVTVFLVLTLRQALIIILIVISPLAFVAFLLPNTEALFNKWRSLLTTLLLMFPIIALIFGGSALASKVIMASDPAFAVQVMGALVAIIPLFITPIVMKSAGGLLNRFGGMVNNPNKGPFDRMRKGAEGYRNNRQEYRKLKSLNGYRSLPGANRFSRKKASREAVLNNRKNELSLATADYVADRATTDDKFRGKLAEGGGAGADMRALASAINVQVELKAKEVKAASAVIENMNLGSGELNNLAKGGVGQAKDGRTLSGADDAVRKAAIMSAISIGTVADVEDIIKSAGSMSSEQQKILGSSVASSGIYQQGNAPCRPNA